MANHYVNNKTLCDALVEYRDKVIESKQNNTKKPPIPNYVGECILLIANRLSHKPNFINYTYREEMISDGIENCICYIDNFDPNKSSNPFAYFTQIIYFAFLRRIQKEKKQLYIKHKAFENSMLMNELVDQQDGDSETFMQNIDFSNENTNEFVKSFESAMLKKRNKKVGIEKFIEEKEDESDREEELGELGPDIDLRLG
jgi:hypothetical protein